MYKSNHIRYAKYSDFGILSKVTSRFLPDSPKQVVETFQQLGDAKNKFTKANPNPTLTQRYEGLVGDVGAATGVLGSALGAGVKKYGHQALNKVDELVGARDASGKLIKKKPGAIRRAITNTGNNLKEWGVDNVIDEAKRMDLGRGVLGAGAVLGGSALTAGGIVGASSLLNRNSTPEYVDYAKARWRTVDFRY